MDDGKNSHKGEVNAAAAQPDVAKVAKKIVGAAVDEHDSSATKNAAIIETSIQHACDDEKLHPPSFTENKIPEDIVVKNAAAQPTYHIAGSHDQSFIGNGNVAIYRFDQKEEYKDTSRASEPHRSRIVIDANMTLSMDGHRNFYRQNRWLIVVRTRRNRTHIVDLVSKLIEPDAHFMYRVQTEAIDCRNYLTYNKIINYEHESITKVIVRDTQNFMQFFREHDDVIGLSEALKSSNNRLIFVIEGEERSIKASELLHYLDTELQRDSLWTPELPESFLKPQEADENLQQLLPPQQHAAIVCAWFNCLPYVVFHDLLCSVLNPLAENSRSGDAEKKLPEWWTDWKIKADSIIADTGIANMSAEDDNYGMRFLRAEREIHVQQQSLRTSPSTLIRLWPALRESLFDGYIDNATWESQLSWQLANYLQEVHRHHLISVDESFLLNLYERVRIDRNKTAVPFHRFLHLLKELHQLEQIKPHVAAFIEQMIEILHEYESNLLDSVGGNVQAVWSLFPSNGEPFSTTSTDGPAYHLQSLNGHIFSVYAVIEAIAGNDTLLFDWFSRILAATPKQVQPNAPPLPVDAIIRYRFAYLLRNSSQLLVNLARNRQSERHRNCKETCHCGMKILLTIAEIELENIVTESAGDIDDFSDLNYLYGLILQPGGPESLPQLLFDEKSTQHTLSTRQKTKRLLLAITRLKCEISAYEQTTQSSDDAIRLALQKLADCIDRETYIEANNLNTERLVFAKKKIVVDMEKSKKIKNIAMKDACLFVKQSFKRQQAETAQRTD